MNMIMRLTINFLKFLLRAGKTLMDIYLLESFTWLLLCNGMTYEFRLFKHWENSDELTQLVKQWAINSQQTGSMAFSISSLIPAFDLLDFQPGSYEDLARSWKIIQEILDSYREVQESRRPTRKSRDKPPDFVGIFRTQSQIFQEFLEFSRIIQDLSGLLLEVPNLQKFII